MMRCLREPSISALSVTALALAAFAAGSWCACSGSFEQALMPRITSAARESSELLGAAWTQPATLAFVFTLSMFCLCRRAVRALARQANAVSGFADLLGAQRAAEQGGWTSCSSPKEPNRSGTRRLK